MRKLIVVGDPRRWDLHVPGVELVASRDYLTDPAYSKLKNVRIFNLSRSYSYQSRGYYVSLLAEARGQKVIPSVRSILDMRSPSLVKVLSRDLDGLVQHTLADVEEDQFTLSVYFGRNVDPKYDRLAHELYLVFQAPLLRARFVRGEKWELRTMRTIP
ncbi:MAG: RimK-like ATPgrasp N-terminal domain-containing protein, partial [Flavobacteriales bacterium]|nr:RimK-like ATPgrasp N-terminal domain-containing protein [Flavobacteriales bacterium]